MKTKVTGKKRGADRLNKEQKAKLYSMVKQCVEELNAEFRPLWDEIVPMLKASPTANRIAAEMRSKGKSDVEIVTSFYNGALGLYIKGKKAMEKAARDGRDISMEKFERILFN